MINNEKKAEQFMKSINAQAEKKYNKIIKETDDYVNHELKKARSAAKANAKNAAKTEIGKISEQTNTDSYKTRTQLVWQIISKRNEITESVFDKAQKKIEEFTESDAYLPFLQKSIGNIKNAIGNETVIYVRPADEKYIGELKEICQDVKTDDSIVLGGCKGVNESASLRADDTLDQRLSEQRQLFYEQSGLSVV